MNLSNDNKQTRASHRRKRQPVSCQHCRHSKLRCDRQQPCTSCKRRGHESSCSFQPNSGISPSSNNVTRARPRTVGSAATGAQSPVVEPVRNANTPPVLQPELVSDKNQAPPDSDWAAVLERPAPEYDVAAVPDTLSPFSVGRGLSLREILEILPPRSWCDFLVSHFFTHIAALFPILHGPTFQMQYAGFMQNPYEGDLSWLALLFSICSLVLYTMDPNDPKLKGLWPKRSNNPAQELVCLSRRLQQTAMACLSKDQFFIRHKLSTLEALLMVIYNLSHNESVDQGWALLGMALNIGIALRCNVDSQHLSPIETERRRRCWAGLLSLHTYQSILFRDVDMSFLLNIKTTMPADVNDSDITESGISPPSNSHKPTQMSVMISKVRLFRLSTEICHHISGPSRLDPVLSNFDAAIAVEQKHWDDTFLSTQGSPSILDCSYAHWCILQTYAYHLYLLLHRPFHHSQKPCFKPSSRERCIASAATLISIHRQLYEAPLLRNYLFLLNGVTSLKALHAAVALDSCLLDMPEGFDAAPYREELENLLSRMQEFSTRSSVCAKGCRILRHLQCVFYIHTIYLICVSISANDLLFFFSFV